WGDYDNDGWLDLAVSKNNQPYRVFYNEGNATFSDASSAFSAPRRPV
ncbi:MAG TPA: hypothetical protein DIT99_22775, partial [Candidatus Latescibacteria bacterium]|nr:hypothetical protein [Candidatus Latescibacterota bacterium]